MLKRALSSALHLCHHNDLSVWDDLHGSSGRCVRAGVSID